MIDVSIVLPVYNAEGTPLVRTNAMDNDGPLAQVFR